MLAVNTLCVQVLHFNGLFIVQIHIIIITQDSNPMLLSTAHVLCMAYNITALRYTNLLIHSIVTREMLTDE